MSENVQKLIKEMKTSLEKTVYTRIQKKFVSEKIRAMTNR